MIYFLLAFFCFIAFILSHALLFRFKVVQFETWKLLALSFFIGVLYLLIAFRIPSGNTLQLIWSSFVCYLLFAIWYLGELTTVQYNSPSMKILRALLARPAQKITLEDVKVLFTDQEMILDRLDDLVLNGHVRKEGSYYEVLPRGKLIIKVFEAYRNLLGRELGG